MHFIIYKMIQLEHVHVTHGYRPVERLARATIKQGRLAIHGKVGQLQHGLDFRFGGAVEHTRRHRHAAAKIMSKLQDFTVQK